MNRRLRAILLTAAGFVSASPFGPASRAQVPSPPCPPPSFNLPSRLAESPVHTAGWAAFRISVPPGGATVHLVVDIRTTASAMGAAGWILRSDGLRGGFTGLWRTEGSHVVHAQLGDPPLVSLDDRDEFSPGMRGCHASGRGLPEGTYLVVLAARARDGSVEGEFAIHAQPGVRIEGASSGIGAFMALGEDFVGAANVRAWSAGVQARGIVLGELRQSTESSMFASLVNANSREPAILGYAGPMGEEVCVNACYLVAATPGDYRFNVYGAADLGIGALPYTLLIGADVHVPS